MNEYIHSLRSFSSWCVDYEYLAHNPFQAPRLLDGETEVERRALTVDEIHLLLTCAPPERRILYETVFLTSMRANECRQLTLHNLNLKTGVILLAAEWTQGRRECEQPAPHWFLKRLHAFGEQKTADSLYRRCRTNRSRLKFPPSRFSSCPANRLAAWKSTSEKQA